jgi:hypothetical protein
MSAWVHDILPVLAAEEIRLGLVGPFGERRWQPIPPERFTEEYIQRETQRLTDELGVRLGVGPMPGKLQLAPVRSGERAHADAHP